MDLNNLRRDLETGASRPVAPGHRSAPWRVAVVVVAALAAVVALVAFGLRRLPASGRAIQSVAVLPFQNESRDADLYYLSDGLTESLINSLSQLPQLRVISRTSAFTFRDGQDDLRSIGKKLGVRTLTISTSRVGISWWEPRASIEGAAQGLARGLSEGRIRGQDIQEDRGVDGGLHLRRFAPCPRLGLGPRSASSAASTEVSRRNVPKIRSTGCSPFVPFRIRAPLGWDSKITGVPGRNPRRSRSVAGTVIWPLAEIVLLTGKE